MISKIIQIIGISFFIIAIWLIIKEVKDIGLEQLWEMVISTPGWVLSLCIFLTLFDYFILSGYDVLSLLYIHKKIPYFHILRASTIGFAISNTAGHAYLSGGAIRYLFYLPEKLTHLEIFSVISFETITIFIGIGITYIISVMMAPFESIMRGYPYLEYLYISAILIFLLLILYVYLIVLKQKRITIENKRISSPSPILSTKQFIVGFCDNLFVFLSFYAIFRYYIDIPFFQTFMVFIIAQTIGLVTQVPGGLGVFEGTFLYLFPHTVDEKSAILASLLIFRVIYYFLPFFLATAYLVFYFLKKRIIH